MLLLAAVAGLRHLGVPCITWSFPLPTSGSVMCFLSFTDIESRFEQAPAPSASATSCGCGAQAAVEVFVFGFLGKTNGPLVPRTFPSPDDLLFFSCTGGVSRTNVSIRSVEKGGRGLHPTRRPNLSLGCPHDRPLCGGITWNL